jgi:hypothetical protein
VGKSINVLCIFSSVGLPRRCTICDAAELSESIRAGPKDLRGGGFLADLVGGPLRVKRLPRGPPARGQCPIRANLSGVT